MDEDRLTIDPPLYLIGMMCYCWRCQAKMPVVALLAPNVLGTEGSICVLSEITELPETLLASIQKRVPTFKLTYSKTVEHKYFANTCPTCGMLTGDFSLHAEPGAPFCPLDEHEAASLYLTELSVSGRIHAKASYGMGPGDLILKYARRIP